MSLTEHQDLIIESLSSNEEAIGQLYEAYAVKFPDYADFWTALANDEKAHANWIRSLATNIEQGSLFFDDRRFNKAAIRTFSDYVGQELAKVQQQMLLINALSITLYIEQALIERKYFEVFESDSPHLKSVLHDLAAATERHVEKVRQLWSRHRRDQPPSNRVVKPKFRRFT